MNKIFEAMGAHAYLNSPEYKKAEKEIRRKRDDEFVRKNTVGVVGATSEAGIKTRETL